MFLTYEWRLRHTWYFNYNYNYNQVTLIDFLSDVITACRVTCTMTCDGQSEERINVCSISAAIGAETELHSTHQSMAAMDGYGHEHERICGHEYQTGN
jgi:hypothetical protein